VFTPYVNAAGPDRCRPDRATADAQALRSLRSALATGPAATSHLVQLTVALSHDYGSKES
jgi:hypothetical protein